MDRNADFSRCFRGATSPARRLAFAIVAIAAFGLASDQVSAQSSGSPADMLQQLQQLGQGRSGSSGGLGQQQLQPTETILQPTAPPNLRLPTSRLEQILSDRAGTRLQQIGYDQLGIGRPVNLPQVGAIPDSYVLGTGDEIVVSLRGQENSEYRVTVDRDGRVVLPRLNPVLAAGRTFGDFRRDLVNAIHRAYVSTEGFISVGRVRQINVLVSGEVGSPGVRILTGLSTPVDAILVSGGVKKTGSLRNLRIVRGGREISVDLYGVLTGNARANAIALADGDRLVVPPLGRTAAVVGWVRRPGIYELAAGRTSLTTRELLALAGGLEVRGKYRMSVLRVTPDGRNQMTPFEGDRGTIGDSDILFVNPAANQTSSVATLSGGTSLAGKYAATGTKLSELLKSPGAFGEDPYTLLGIISRRDPSTLLRVLIPFTPTAVLRGSEDMIIQSDDIVRVISTKEARLLFAAVKLHRAREAASQDALINPQLTPADKPDFTRGGGDYLSNNQNPTQYGPNGQPNQLPSGTASNVGPVQNDIEYTRWKQRQQINDANPQAQELAALDMIGEVLQPPLPQQQYLVPGYQDQANLAQGDPGQVPATRGYPYPNYQAQGFSTNQPQDTQQFDNSTQGYPPQTQDNLVQGYRQFGGQTNEPNIVPNGEFKRFSDLARQLRVDPFVLINFLDDQVVNIDGAVQGPGIYLVGPDAELQAVLAAAGGLARWADKSTVEVISTAVDPSSGKSRTDRRTLSLVDPSQASYIISPRDELRVNEVYTAVGFGSVTVQGQVRHAGTYQIVRGEHLSDVLMRAGGLTEIAYPYGTVFLRKSSAQREQESFKRQAQEIQDQLVLAMSRRDTNSKLSPDAFTAMQTYVREIRDQKPLGRVVVSADPALLAANPGADPLLEAGDVVYIPQRPYSVSVLGEVLQPGSIPFRRDMSPADYIDSAGGYSQFADKSETILVLPDGSARRLSDSWLDFDDDKIPPGSTIFVARDVSGVDLQQIITQTTSLVSQLAVTAASLAVLSKQ